MRLYFFFELIISRELVCNPRWLAVLRGEVFSSYMLVRKEYFFFITIKETFNQQ